MERFLRIGDFYLNLDNVTRVYVGDDIIYFIFPSEAFYVVKAKNREELGNKFVDKVYVDESTFESVKAFLSKCIVYCVL